MRVPKSVPTKPPELPIQHALPATSQNPFTTCPHRNGSLQACEAIHEMAAYSPTVRWQCKCSPISQSDSAENIERQNEDSSITEGNIPCSRSPPKSPHLENPPSIQTLPNTQEIIYYQVEPPKQEDIDKFEQACPHILECLTHQLGPAAREHQNLVIELYLTGKKKHCLRPTVIITCCSEDRKKKIKKALKKIPRLKELGYPQKVLVDPIEWLMRRSNNEPMRPPTLRFLHPSSFGGGTSELEVAEESFKSSIEPANPDIEHVDNSQSDLEGLIAAYWEVEGQIIESNGQSVQPSLEIKSQTLCSIRLRFKPNPPNLQNENVQREATSGGLILVGGQPRVLTVAHPFLVPYLLISSLSGKKETDLPDDDTETSSNCSSDSLNFSSVDDAGGDDVEVDTDFHEITVEPFDQLGKGLFDRTPRLTAAHLELLDSSLAGTSEKNPRFRKIPSTLSPQQAPAAEIPSEPPPRSARLEDIAEVDELTMDHFNQLGRDLSDQTPRLAAAPLELLNSSLAGASAHKNPWVRKIPSTLNPQQTRDAEIPSKPSPQSGRLEDTAEAVKSTAEEPLSPPSSEQSENVVPFSSFGDISHCVLAGYSKLSSRNADWALVTVRDSLILPNLVHCPGKAGARSIEHIATGSLSGAVFIAAGVSGLTYGYLNPVSAIVQIDGSSFIAKRITLERPLSKATSKLSCGIRL